MSTPLPPRGRGTATNLHNRFAPTLDDIEALASVLEEVLA